ncbi:MAG: hypothetical protein LBP52_04270 [Burkholderiaceae bacterium]|nr:hypothetical protein [Burkholderiaceae bacterium]
MKAQFVWPATCAALIVACAVFWFAARGGAIGPQDWVWHASDGLGRPWTLWSSALVHHLPPHGIGNVLALAALAVLGHTLAATPNDAAALLLAWPLSALALFLWPQVTGFHGLSGVVHAAVAIVAMRAAADPAMRWLGQFLALGLLFKLALEHGWAAPVGYHSDWGFNVVYAAHLTGALAGFLFAGLFWLFSSGGKGAPPS